MTQIEQIILIDFHFVFLFSGLLGWKGWRAYHIPRLHANKPDQISRRHHGDQQVCIRCQPVPSHLIYREPL